VRPRETIRSRAFSAFSIVRMQWWMRPGPSVPRDLEAAAFAEQNVVPGYLTLLKRRCIWPRGAWSCPNTWHRPMISTPACPGSPGSGTAVCLAARPIGLHHHDHDLAARDRRGGDLIFLGRLITIRRRRVLPCVEMFWHRRCDIGFGHGVGGDGSHRLRRAASALRLLRGRAGPAQHSMLPGSPAPNSSWFPRPAGFLPSSARYRHSRDSSGRRRSVIGQEEVPQTLLPWPLPWLSPAPRSGPA